MKIIKSGESLSIIILSVIFGLSGGVVGGIFAKSYFFNFEYDFPYVNQITNVGINRNITVGKDATKILIQPDERTTNVIELASESIVGIYKKISSKSLPVSSVGDFNLYQYYNFQTSLATGIIITSDGWLISSFAPDKTINYVAITKDKKIYDIDEIIDDKLSSYKFLHIAVNDLPVKKLLSENEIKNGSTLLAVNWQGADWVSIISDKNSGNNMIKSSDYYFNKIKLVNSLPNNFFSTALFNLNGDLAALVDNNGNIESIYHWKNVINSLLEHKNTIRTFFGVNYISLSSLVNSDTLQTQKKGLVLYQDKNVKAVIKNGPADLAGLKAGDIVLEVDNVEIDKNNDFLDIIQSYQPGDKINISYERDGQKYEARVVLDGR